MDSATRAAAEPRKAMMAVAKVSWEDCDETVHTAPAKIEDTSPSGACFRLKVPIEAGTRIHVSWCRDDFSGTAKWCRADEGEYVVGMRRDQVARPTPVRMAPRLNAVNPHATETASMVRADTPRVHPVEAPPSRRVDTPRVRQVEAQSTRLVDESIVHEASEPSVREVGAPGVREVDLPVERHGRPELPGPPHIPEFVQNISAQRPLIRRGTLTPIAKPAPLPLLRIEFPPAEIHKPLIGFEIARDNEARRTAASEPVNSGMQYQKRTTSFFEERTDMQNKWLNLGNRRQQQDGGNGGNHGTPGMNGDATTATPRGDLLLLEDIYRTAGIMEPRMGYSITKVVEMLRSDHLRGLGDEVKRASVLMALSAAGIPLGDILQDAAHRQAAVAAYEVDQRNKFEEYWSRRAEENSQLQTEMERVTRQYVEKMNRNLTEVQQEKEAFQKWQNGMQYEVLQISEAVTLCAQPAVFEQAAPERPAAAGSPSGQSLVAKSA
jgi:hypothetical protein